MNMQENDRLYIKKYSFLILYFFSSNLYNSNKLVPQPATPTPKVFSPEAPRCLFYHTNGFAFACLNPKASYTLKHILKSKIITQTQEHTDTFRSKVSVCKQENFTKHRSKKQLYQKPRETWTLKKKILYVKHLLTKKNDEVRKKYLQKS